MPKKLNLVTVLPITSISREEKWEEPQRADLSVLGKPKSCHFKMCLVSKKVSKSCFSAWKRKGV